MEISENLRLLLQALSSEESLLDLTTNTRPLPGRASQSSDSNSQPGPSSSNNPGPSHASETTGNGSRFSLNVRSPEVSDRLADLFGPYAERASTSRARAEPHYSRSEPYSTVARLQELREASPTNTRRGGNPVPRMWEGKITFLGDPAEEEKPNQERRRALQRAKLGGASGLSFDLSDSNDALLGAIMRLFDKDCAQEGRPNSRSPGFTFRLAYIEEQHDKMLTFFKDSFVPTHLKLFGTKRIYAIPSLVLLPLPRPADDDDEDFVTVVGGNGNDNSPVNSRGSVDTNATSDLSSSVSAGFHYPADLTHITDVEHLRRHLDFLYPGTQHIESPPIGNSNLPLSLLLPKFLNETISDQKASIIQENRDTIDLGGPLKSFIWKLSISLHEEKLNFTQVLEGDVDHRSISSCVCLQQDRIFTMLGRFIAFSIRNLGVCLLGLSKVSIKMLCSNENVPPSDIDVADLCDAGDQNIVTQMIQQLDRGVISSDHDLRYRTQSLLRITNWTYPLNMGNLKAAIDHIKTFKVVTLKQQAFQQLREGFLSTDTGKWISTHPECWETVFPRLLLIDSTVDDVMSAIDTDNDLPAGMMQYMHDYLQSSGQIAEFVEAVTGHPYLLGGSISIVLDNTLTYFKAFTCTSQLQVFECPSYQVFQDNMAFFLKCAKGYTEV